jgi:ABC-type polysaccharide/polyol phosphate export permease
MMKLDTLARKHPKFLASWDLLWNLALRELRTKYRRSFLGWTWSLLNPLAMVAIYSFVFSRLFEASAPAGENSPLNNYALYLLVAVLPWGFFGIVTNFGMSALTGNSGLVRKVSFPRQTLVLSQVLFAFVQFSIEMSLLTVMLLILGSPIWLHIPLILLNMVIFAMFAAGFALALSVLSVYFRDLVYLWGVFFQIWFFATPIVYPAALLEGRVSGSVIRLLNLNPIAHFVESFRDLMYHGTLPTLKNYMVIVTSAVISVTLGWKIFNRMARRLAEEL